MGWDVYETPVSPVSRPAVYFLVLPDSNEVLYSYEISEFNAPMHHSGDFAYFINGQGSGVPLIPMDSHHALLLGWVTIDEMARNRPYLDDAIKAAIALVA